MDKSIEILLNFRIIIFFTLFLILFFFEKKYKMRNDVGVKSKRVSVNFLILTIYSLLIYFFIPINLVLFASKIEHHFYSNSLPRIIFELVLLDFFIYWQHVFSHKVNFFWRFHQVHHSDCDLDTSSGFRFHPIEIVLSFFYKLLIIYMIKPLAISVLMFEIILSSMAMFNHSNLFISRKIDQFLKKFIVTPSYHIIHHQKINLQMNSNFGFNLSIWDKIFGTYIEKIEKYEIGIERVNEEESMSLWKMLRLPFSRKR